jgi:hypothetical protein
VTTKSKSEVSGEASDKLTDDLVRRYGPMIGGSDLFHVLGYRSGQAFRQAVRQGRLGIHVFNLPARQGKFALTADVAAWIQSASEAK